MGRLLVASVLVMAAPPSATTAAEPHARPEVLARVVECTRIADVAARVACYDRTVAALDQAERNHDVEMVARADVRQARRSLFGFPLPRINLFKGDDREPEFTRIEASLTGARRSGDQWLFELSDGSRWVQSESGELARSPKPGDRIRIRRAAMGSFFANINTAPAIRVRRVE